MNILVYLGANLGNDEKYKKAALEVADWISANGYGLVYGGNSKGLMGILASRVVEKGGKVIGIMPGFLMDLEARFEGCSEFITTSTMQERKDLMRQMAQACIALPGGAGTMEEITEAYSLYKVGQNPNPCILYNKDGYYNHLEAMYDTMVEAGLLTKEDRKDLLFSEDFQEIEAFIKERINDDKTSY